MTLPLTEHEQHELTYLADAESALAPAVRIAGDVPPKAEDERLLALAYAMLTL